MHQHNFYDYASEVDKLMTHYSTEKLSKIETTFDNVGLLEYFFKKLATVSNPDSWLIPLKEKDYFNPKNNKNPQKVADKPDLYTIPQWNVLDYLENVANKNAKKPSSEITDTLIEIVNSIIQYRDENDERIDNYRTDWFMIKIIATFPIEKIEDQHIEFVRTALKTSWGSAVVESEIGKSLLPYMIKNKARVLILKLLEVVFDFQIGKEGDKEKYKSLMDKHWISTALKKNKSEIIKICGVEPALIALDKMKAVIKISDSHFHIPWIPSIEDHAQNRHFDKYEYQLVHFVRDTLEQSPAEDVKEVIEKLLIEVHHIFKRLAVHTINHHYDSLNEMFWSWEGNPLDEYGLKHEIYELLKINCKSFNNNQINKIIEWIETKDYYIPEEIKDDKEKKERYMAYKKKEWLSALLETDNVKINELFNKYEEINPSKIEHAGFDYWSETGWGTISPITQEELYKKSNSEIADYLNSYKEEGLGWKTPTKEGLSEEFRKCISNNPEKFAEDLNPFHNIQRTYQHDLLWGLWEAWRNNKSFEWAGLFQFIMELISPEEFWSEEYGADRRDYRDSIISLVAELINDGTRDDSRAFKSELLSEAEKILLIIAGKTESRLHEMGDLITSVLNSTKGKIFAAMVNYSLRYARLYKKNKEERWKESIENYFTKRLDKEYEPSLEFSVILGEYLPNLYYLNRKWVEDNINRIFPKTNETHWKAAFSGYLFYASTVYEELYDVLRKNGHYDKAILTDSDDDSILERLVQHICLGYLQGWEKLDTEDSLLVKLISNNKPEQLSQIVSFFGSRRGKQIDKPKIKPLWKKIFNIASQETENTEYRNILSNISKWLSLVEEIDDEIFEWLKLSAQYVEVNHNTYFFMEYLAQHVDKETEKVGKLYLGMIESDILPELDEIHIKKIIETLYEKGQKDTANKICNRYGEESYSYGYGFMRDLYEKYKT